MSAIDEIDLEEFVFAWNASSRAFTFSARSP